MTPELPFKGIRGIVLDAVGTLIEPTPAVADVYLAAAARQGVVIGREEVRARFGRYFRDDELDETRGPMVTSEPLERRRWRRIVGAVLAEVDDPDRAFGELWDHFARPESWRCFADVGPALDVLTRAGLPVRIASNFDGRLRQVVAGLSELAALGETLVISSEVGVRKPHPDFYRAACRGLGLSPESVLWVGDDFENDLEGPRRIGSPSRLLGDRRGAGPGELMTLVSEL